jgi:hypothetical protein
MLRDFFLLLCRARRIALWKLLLLLCRFAANQFTSRDVDVVVVAVAVGQRRLSKTEVSLIAALASTLFI